MRFSFVGKFEYKDDTFERVGTTKSGAEYRSINFSVVASQNNRAFVECFGMKQDTIKTMDTENNKIEIAYKDACDPEVIKAVASYRKHIVAIDGGRDEYISDYDFVNYISNIKSELKGRLVMVTGTTSLNEYEGKLSQRFNIQNIYTVDEDRKNKLTVNTDAYWSVDDIDLDSWTDEKKIYINGYIPAYINKDVGNKYVPQQFIFDASKVDFNNEEHVKLISYKLKVLGFKLEDGKVKSTLKKNKVYAIPVIVNYVNGAQEIDFDESQLTPLQKEAIELGLKELKDFAPSNQLYGQRVIQFKITDFVLRDKSESGIYDTEFSTEEFEEQIYTPAKTETLEEVLKKADAEVSAEEDDELDDLFD